jgi:hypothetical protein
LIRQGFRNFAKKLVSMRIFTLLLVSLLLSTHTFSQNWTGSVSSDWNNSANWSTWPLNGEDLVVDPANFSGVAAQPIIASNSVFTPGAVLIQNGGVLTVGANLTTSDDVECIGAGSMIIQSAGTFSVNSGGGGRLIIDLGGAMTLVNGTVDVGERFIAGEDALVTINDGTAISGQRLLMDLGGQFIQNGGFVQVTGVCAMADGSLLNNSGYTLNAGTLEVIGEVAMECEAGNFQPYFTQNGGLFFLTGDLFWFGSSPGTGQGRFTLNSGTATVSGIAQNMPLSTMNLYLHLRNDGNLNLNGSLLEAFLPADSILMDGNPTLNFNGVGNLINPGVLLATGGKTFFNATTSINGAGSFQWHDVEINSAATIQVLTANDQNVSGDFIHEGTYQANNSVLRLNGALAQSMDGNNTMNISHLTLDHSGSGVTLNVPLNMTGNLVLNNGIFFTNPTDEFVLYASANSTPGNANAYIDGPMHKVGNTAFVFPVGNNGRWARIEKSATTAVTDTYVAEYFASSYPQIVPVNSPLSAVSNLEYWSLSPIFGNDPITVSIYWEDAASSAISDCNDLTIAQWNGSAWDNILSTTSGVCTGNGSGFVTSANTVNTPGIFTFGFYSGVTTQNLSICAGEQVVVGSNTYQSTGVYIDYLLDVNLNDSIVITNLTVITPNPSVQLNGSSLEASVQTASGYNWLDCAANLTPVGVNTFNFTPSQNGIFALEIDQNGCVDTSLCLYFTLENAAICPDESYVLAGQNYSSSGTYSAALTAVDGLDSMVVVNLSALTVDTQISLNGITLSSANVNATAFQWIDCQGGFVPGATSSSFTPSQNGTYALIVSENGCVDTSVCLSVNTIGIEELTLAALQIYPNPSMDGKVQVECPKAVRYVLYDLKGNRLLSGEMQDVIALDLSTLSKGMYLIQLTRAGGDVHTRKLRLE